MDNKIDRKILEELYQYGTPEISDALDACGISGYLNGIKPLTSAKKVIGPAFTIAYKSLEHAPEKFMQASNYIDDVPPGSVIVIHNEGNVSCSVWGKILTHYAVHKKIKGTIIYGAARDAEAHEQYQYPLFALGVTARSGKNRARIVSQKTTLQIEGVTINHDDIIFADPSGVIVIPKESIGKILKMVQNIAITERKIITAIDQGTPLKEARDRYHYDKPWEDP